jgi:hypothetical protein|tara:strand:- start:310 stop:537 length:228 start_codon:yes stop_codon:yes gene_type:complete
MTDDERYCDDMRELFMSRGWSHIVEELEEFIESASGIDSVSTLEQLHFNKGAVSVAEGLLRLPADIESIEAEDVH